MVAEVIANYRDATGLWAAAASMTSLQPQAAPNSWRNSAVALRAG